MSTIHLSDLEVATIAQGFLAVKEALADVPENEEMRKLIDNTLNILDRKGSATGGAIKRKKLSSKYNAKTEPPTGYQMGGSSLSNIQSAIATQKTKNLFDMLHLS